MTSVTFFSIIVGLIFIGTVQNPVSNSHAQFPFIPSRAPGHNLTESSISSNMPASNKPALPESTLGNLSGTISSLQNNESAGWLPQFHSGKLWVLSGKWSMIIPNKSVLLKGNQANTSSSPIFNASFTMVRLNGSGIHRHTISEFKLTKQPITNSSDMSTTFHGTATITMKDGPHRGIPLVIKLIDKSVISITTPIPTKINKQFGYTPIFGIIKKMA